MRDRMTSSSVFSVKMEANGMLADNIKSRGEFTAICRDKDGNELWRETFPNLLTEIGKALLLDQGLGGVAYTAVEYIGFISSIGFTAISGGDTMASHAGWVEGGTANQPTYTAPRKTCVWSAAALSGTPLFEATKSLTAGAVYTITGTGTIQGGFIVAGAGASATIDNTGGTLYAAGTFGTPQPVVPTNSVTILYSTTLT